MSYYLSAWVSSGEIAGVETDTNLILENHMPDLSHDFRVVAEVSGQYQDASVVLPLLVWQDNSLSGLDFISQQVFSA